MRPAFIIGNGESRKPIDLKKLKRYGTTFGCNAIIRDFYPDYLVALDRKMEVEIDRNYSEYKGYKIYRKINTHKDPLQADYSIKIAPRQVVNSGVCAIYCAMKLGYKEIWLLGFDLSINNIYAGTAGYGRVQPKQKGGPPKRVQIHQQIGKWAKLNQGNITFNRVIDDGCFMPNEFNGVVKHFTAEEFNELYK